MERPRLASDASSASASLHRRPTRQNTVRNYHSPSHPNWETAGAEPGIDTSKEPEAHFNLMQECQITVVDFSDERMSKYELDNEGLVEFLKDPREDWVACRWINVNGLSWDVIKELGNKHGLHRLAIEDLMNTRGRTKADWYSDHAFSTCLSLLPARSPYLDIGMYTERIYPTLEIEIVTLGGTAASSIQCPSKISKYYWFYNSLNFISVWINFWQSLNSSSLENYQHPSPVESDVRILRVSSRAAN